MTHNSFDVIHSKNIKMAKFQNQESWFTVLCKTIFFSPEPIIDIYVFHPSIKKTLTANFLIQIKKKKDNYFLKKKKIPCSWRNHCVLVRGKCQVCKPILFWNESYLQFPSLVNWKYHSWWSLYVLCKTQKKNCNNSGSFEESDVLIIYKWLVIFFSKIWRGASVCKRHWERN